MFVDAKLLRLTVFLPVTSFLMVKSGLGQAQQIGAIE